MVLRRAANKAVSEGFCSTLLFVIFPPIYCLLGYIPEILTLIVKRSNILPEGRDRLASNTLEHTVIGNV